MGCTKVEASIATKRSELMTQELVTLQLTLYCILELNRDRERYANAYLARASVVSHRLHRLLIDTYGYKI